MPERRSPAGTRRVPAPLRRLPAQLRTALVAGLAALLLSGGAAWWFRQYVHDAVYQESDQRAIELSLRLAGQAATGWKGTSASPGDGTFLQIDRTGRIVTGSGGALDLADLPALLPPPPPGPPPGKAVGQPRDGTVRLRGVDEAERARFHLPDGSLRPISGGFPEAKDLSAHTEAHYLSHRLIKVVATPVTAPAGRCEHPTEPDGSCRSTLYVLVAPYVAEYVAGTLTLPLALGVPAAALAVATTAWAVTRRSLRPVEAIRREVAEINDSSLDRRVPVPEGRDPIRSLARTTNTTLDRLEDAVDSQRRFVADAAHELRSPLAALHYQLETALDHPDSIDPAETLKGALVATRRIHGLTEDLLLLARPDRPAAHSLVDLAGLTRELVLEYQHMDHPVTLSRAPDQAPVRGDGLQLHRLLRNLLDNAVRHARTAVLLNVTDDGRTTTITVHNDGTALTPDECERVFERFTRLDEARTRDAGGSGLGLAIARDIAHRHHGTLTAHPADPPPGTTFTLHIPTAPHPARPSDADTTS
ncbi:two-component histidine kinase [Streptomyces sp. NBRC 110611]|uniref:sensor histidine kinase n=1 Tax=Streptomyces sp. NBRC 110611 TaxID=1621259 RepID=UPI000855FBCA|nr:HAMP domain-containing sensor histidine kinase [Streptomyces sp. NBRC 110611]GAU70673.1 two-component histidine kinase [Streptomyces sp. NBRC 110611]